MGLLPFPQGLKHPQPCILGGFRPPRWWGNTNTRSILGPSSWVLGWAAKVCFISHCLFGHFSTTGLSSVFSPAPSWTLCNKQHLLRLRTRCLALTLVSGSVTGACSNPTSSSLGFFLSLQEPFCSPQAALLPKEWLQSLSLSSYSSGLLQASSLYSCTQL